MWEYAQVRWYNDHMSRPIWRLDEPGWDRSWESMLDALHALAADGWEAVSVVSLPSAIAGVPSSEYVLLKRRRAKDDSCQSCLEREAQWSPLRIRNGEVL